METLIESENRRRETIKAERRFGAELSGENRRWGREQRREAIEGTRGTEDRGGSGRKATFIIDERAPAI